MKRNFLRVGVLALAGVLSLGLAATTTGAAVVMTENFTYADGTLTTVSGGLWGAHSGAGVIAVQVASGAAVLQQGSGTREDVNRLHAAQGAAAATYVSFKAKVRSGAISFGAGDYLAHFRNSGTFIYPARVYVAAPSGGGDFRFGLSGTSTGTTPIVYWPSGATYDTYYTIVAKYDAATGGTTMWVNPAVETDPSIVSNGGPAGDIIDSYALRQSGGNACTQDVDDIIVGQTFADVVPPPVPGTPSAGLALLASLMLGAGALFVVRRRATVA